MKIFQSNVHGKALSILILALSVLCVPIAQSQTPCPSQNGRVTTNPEFPGCLPPGSGAFRVLLVLDESGSMQPVRGQFINAVRGFATTLSSNVSGTGEVQMGIVEFSSSAQIGMNMTDVANSGFISAVNSYLNNGYSPNGQTNFTAALNTARTISDVDILFFITDGNPVPSVNPEQWRSVANAIKCSGTYIFGMGLGRDISELNIKMLSGPDELNNPKSLSQGADWTLQTINNLSQALIDLANSQIDRQAPSVTCPGNIVRTNDMGQCGAVIAFNPSASDNCSIANSSSTPASGSFFPVGQTTVTFRATDHIGLSSSCTFRIMVNDFEAPQIDCPSDITVNCEASLEPASIGEPITLDNCVVSSTNFSDQTLPGSCANESTVIRTWTVTDDSGNTSTCRYTIHREDITPPVITCPADITVDCDMSVAATGSATATDNCDIDVSLANTDRFVSGDCEWLCTMERTWTATDNCRNVSNCVQRITKNTAPVIEGALPIKLGLTSSTIEIPAGRGNCIVNWLPASGTEPKTLAFKNLVVGTDCSVAPNQMTEGGRIVNPLLGEAIKMSILVKLKPEFGTRKVNTFGCTIPAMVNQNLAPNADVNEFLRVTNSTLGNVTVQPFMQDWLNVMRCINGSISVCD
ncbi:MAG: HYR domain-containing protein [Saprospiraceae bacterium]